MRRRLSGRGRAAVTWTRYPGCWARLRYAVMGIVMSETKRTRLTMAQALVRFLHNQYVQRDGRETQFFAGVWGIFGHGNLAGVGQALQENPDLRYYLARNEQAMVHAAAGFAKMSNRLRAFACTSSIGPGAANMVTGAAGG